MGFELETQGSLSSSDYQSSSSSGAESQREGSRRRSSSLLRHQSSSCLAVLRGHEGDVFSLAHSGQTLYSGSDCGEVRAWRWPLVAAGELDQSIQGKFGPATQFGCGEGSVKAMVVIGHKVFTAHQDHKIRVWKRSKKTEVGACTGASHKLVATLPTVKDYVVTCITPKAYIQVRRHKKALWIDHHDTISVLAVGKNVLYSGSWDKTIKVWRLADLKCVESIAAHSDAVNALVVDPHRGFLYSGSADGSVKVWERRSKHMIKLPARVSSSSLRHALVSILQPAKVSTINALALAGGPDSTHSSGVASSPCILYAGLSDSSIAVWQMDDEGTVNHMKNVAMLRGHRLAVLCLASTGDLLLSGSADKTIRVWRRTYNFCNVNNITINLEDELYGFVSHQCINVLEGHTRPVKCLAVALNPVLGTLAYSGSMDQSVRVWSATPDEDEESDKNSSPSLSSREDEFMTPLVKSPLIPLFAQISSTHPTLFASKQTIKSKQKLWG